MGVTDMKCRLCMNIISKNKNLTNNGYTYRRKGWFRRIKEANGRNTHLYDLLINNEHSPLVKRRRCHQKDNSKHFLLGVERFCQIGDDGWKQTNSEPTLSTLQSKSCLGTSACWWRGQWKSDKQAYVNLPLWYLIRGFFSNQGQNYELGNIWI